MGKDRLMDKEFLASKEFLDYMRKESRKVGGCKSQKSSKYRKELLSWRIEYF